MLGVVFVVSLALLGGSAVMAQRGYKRCIACKRRFPRVADRVHHEKVSHQL